MLYETRQCSVSLGIAQVEPEKDFKILIGNFADKFITLIKGQRVVTADTYPSAITESPITHIEIFGIEEHECHAHKKRIISACDTVLVNKYFRDSRNSHIGEDKKPGTTEEIDLSDFYKIFHQHIRDMSREHESMWNGRVGHISIAEHVLDQIDLAGPFN